MENQTHKQAPGVDAVEGGGFSNSVAAVPTAVPVFVGYTEIAQNGKQDLTNVAVPISSMDEFVSYYGSTAAGMNNGAPAPVFSYASAAFGTPPFQTDPAGPRFNLFYSLMLYFNNGGGICYLMSIGSYADKIANPPVAADYSIAWRALDDCIEATLVVMPDTMLLSQADWIGVSQQTLQHCAQMQNRIAIFDIWDGYKASDGGPSDPIRGASATTGFYPIGALGEEFNKFGAAYYPWVNTNIVSANDINYSWFSAGSLALLRADLKAEAPTLFAPDGSGAAAAKTYAALLDSLVLPLPVAPPADPFGKVAMHALHVSISALSPLYRQAMADLATSVNLLPTAGGIAGVYVRNDDSFGVWQAPANTTIISAISPSVDISDSGQEDLNMPLNGLAVNAIRSFPNAGLLIWGARTMAGNSDDWRYISVRRTAIMLAQSIKAAMASYVFAPNTAPTWSDLRFSISNFLNAQWQVGALAGGAPSDAYSVAVGLGSSMTDEDILQGFLVVNVAVAMTHPAEFIMLTFQQQLQTS
ncbi:MAG: phage tail sheath C-terminal domain-containing protein [Pseudomonadota bacterium]